MARNDTPPAALGILIWLVVGTVFGAILGFITGWGLELDFFGFSINLPLRWWLMYAGAVVIGLAMPFFWWQGEKDRRRRGY